MPASLRFPRNVPKGLYDASKCFIEGDSRLVGINKSRASNRINRGASRKLTIAANNTGNTHVQVLGFKIFSGASELPQRAPPETAYVLPGQGREWRLRLTSVPAAGSSVRIEAKTDAGDLQANVVVTGS